MEPKEHLSWLLDNHVDRIPKRRVHGGNFKVRGNWFQGVIGDLEGCIEGGVIQDPQVVAEAQDFIEEHLRHDFSRRTTIKDIEKANAIIRKVLGEDPKV